MAEQVFLLSGPTVQIAATTTPQRIARPMTTNCVRMLNAGQTLAFVRFGANNMDASTLTSMPLQAGATEVFRMPQTAQYISIVLLSGTGTVYVTPGEGS